MNLPSGTVTFLCADIAGSVLLWERYPEAMREAIARYDEIAGEIVPQYGGMLVRRLAENGNLTAFATDPVAALNVASVTGRLSHVSTAGGAFLESLEGKTLPGVKVLLLP